MPVHYKIISGGLTWPSDYDTYEEAMHQAEDLYSESTIYKAISRVTPLSTGFAVIMFKDNNDQTKT